MYLQQLNAAHKSIISDWMIFAAEGIWLDFMAECRWFEIDHFNCWELVNILLALKLKHCAIAKDQVFSRCSESTCVDIEWV